MIRITLIRRPYLGPDRIRHFPVATTVHEFSDDAAAARWFTEDSYFAEPYTTTALWERIEEEKS